MNTRTKSALVVGALRLHGCSSHESLVPGEDVALNRVRVVGTVTEPRVVRPCTERSHLLERLE